MGLHLPEKGEHPKVDEWVIVLGGSGSVGQFAVQVRPSIAPSVFDMNANS
jgi:NADPH:quinone reductase-like Zn-dependent oxidoreductase